MRAPHFAQLAKCPPAAPRRVPVTAVFVYGLTAMLVTSLVAAAWDVGFLPALRTIVPGVLSAALFIFVFIRELREPLSP